MTPRRVLAGIVAAMAVAAVVALAFAGGDSAVGPRGSSSPTESTTTSTKVAPRETTTTTEAPTTTVPAEAIDADRDVVAEPIGDRRVIVLRARELASIHLDTNVEVELDHNLQIDPTRFPLPVMLAAGDNVFVQTAAKVYVVPQALDRNVRELGEALAMLRSRTPGRVWVVRERDGGYALDEIGFDGATTRSSRPLPIDATPIDVAGDAVVLSTFDGVQVWDPSTGRVRWTSPQAATFVASTDRVLVWRRPCDPSPLCVLHVVDLATSTDRTIPTGALAVDGFQSGFSASPDGRYLAATSAFYGERPTFKLAVIDLETGVIAEVDALQTGRPIWSPDGQWILLEFGGDPGQPIRDLFRVDGLNLREVGIRLPFGSPAAAVVVL